MAKKIMVSTNLDEPIYNELVLFAEHMNVSKSAAINMLVGGCLGVGISPSDLVKQMIKPDARNTESKAVVMASMSSI